MYILNFIRGFCMALADSVPGVSGGTIAFILGFYDDFVDSLNNIVSGDRIGRINALKFLSKIGIGWVVGFIIASIPLIIKSEKNTLIENKRNIIYLVIGIIVVCAMTYFNPSNSTSQSFSLKSQNLNIALITYIFVSGLIAISAMVLPGISGSTILLIFGLYVPILNGLKEILKLKFEYLPAIIIFCVGVVLGILLTVRVVRYLLRTYRSQTIYCIIGLMIGSTYAVIMGPTSLEVPKPPMSIDTFSVLFFVIGCILVPGLEVLKGLLKQKSDECESTSI